MIGFIGDSLMRGISMPEAFGQPYPALWADATGSGIQNFGLGGDCSGAESSVYVGGAKQRLIDRVLPYGYEDGIAVGLGANDVLQGVSAATMLTNVADMIASCIAYGVRAIVLFEVTPQDAANGAQNTKIATINAGLATLATAHPGYVSVAPLHASEADATKLTPAFTNDGLHFTAAGHIAAAAALETANIFGRTV